MRLKYYMLCKPRHIEYCCDPVYSVFLNRILLFSMIKKYLKNIKLNYHVFSKSFETVGFYNTSYWDGGQWGEWAKKVHI